MSSLLIQNGTLVSATEQWTVDVLVLGNRIEKIAYHDMPDYALPSVPDGPIDEVIDATGLLILPGLIDCHVHFREPGLTHKATMKTEAASARAGGVLTVCEMPNTNPPTVTATALQEKISIAKSVTDCDIHFFFGITDRAHIEYLKQIWTDPDAEGLKKRCCGVKLFLDHSTGDQKAEGAVVEAAFRVCAQLKIPVVCHCEDSDINAQALAKNTQADITAHSKNRPPESEAASIEYAIGLSKKFGTHLHVAHLSTMQGIALVAKAKKEKLNVTCEVAPHHLFLTVDDYAELGAYGKMNPPLRTVEHRDALWKGIEDGIVDCIATDHAPHTREDKIADDLQKIPSGVPGVETMIPLLLSVAGGTWPHPGKFSVGSFQLAVPDIVRLCFENPNQIFNLQKSGIVEGAKAEIVLVDPKAQWTVDPRKLHSKCGWTPFSGWQLQGQIIRVIA